MLKQVSLNGVYLKDLELHTVHIAALVRLGFSILAAGKGYFTIQLPAGWRYSVFLPIEAHGFWYRIRDEYHRERGIMAYDSKYLPFSDWGFAGLEERAGISRYRIVQARHPAPSDPYKPSAPANPRFSWEPSSFFRITGNHDPRHGKICGAVVMNVHCLQWRNVAYYIEAPEDVQRLAQADWRQFVDNHMTQVSYELEGACQEWLNTHFPRWRDPYAYWDDPAMQRVFVNENSISSNLPHEYQEQQALVQG